MKTDLTSAAELARHTEMPTKRVLNVAHTLRECMGELERMDLGPAALHVSRALTNLQDMADRRRFV